MLDFHNGFGAMIQGHAHPAIGRALAARYLQGSHLAAPTEDAIVVGEELARRWRLPKWRFTNSGSEATMDAIRIARGYTGREVVLKTSGSYHGHHDAVMVSGEAAANAPVAPRRGPGIPSALEALTVAVPYNDAAAMDRRVIELERDGLKPACVIVEPAMMLGMVLPEPGYLDAVRAITREHGIVLISDEVKTGLTIAGGGAFERFGFQGDLVTLAKALGGGLPSGAIGGTEELMAVVGDGSVAQMGTFNGNSLAMAGARATLFDVLTPAAYAHLEFLSDRLIEGTRRLIAEQGAPGYAQGIGARGYSTFGSIRIVDRDTFLASEDPELGELIWLYNANRGVYTTAARPGQWLVSVTHSAQDVDAYLQVFGELSTELFGSGGRDTSEAHFINAD